MFTARNTRSYLVCLLVSTCLLSAGLGSLAGAAEGLTVHLRSRAVADKGDDTLQVLCRTQQWNPAETAVIVCDMWDQHWCKGAAQRAAELPPIVNEVVSIARDKGVLIIHAPSETMAFYKDHPARRLAQSAPKAGNLPADIAKWCNWRDDTEKKAGYPIDHSDGGCDCQPKCKQGSPWTRQIDTIQISDQDAVSDSGTEIWNLLEYRGVKNVIILGVHTNMCVLGRPFGLRNLARFGKNVVLVRDLTDTMYNSQARPFVNHFTGTDLIVEHVERLVCPTIASTVFTHRPPFRFKDDKRPLVVFVSAEGEYKAAQTLPEFAQELQLKYGLACEVLQGSTASNAPDRYEISGMETLANADLAVVFVRRKAFPTEQMKYLRDYLDRGGPLIGLRTASHAFAVREALPPAHADWPKFDPEVLGGNYRGHYGAGPITTVTPANPTAVAHPILTGVKTPFSSNGSLYQASPLGSRTTVLLMGAIPDKASEPVAWTNTYKSSRVFYTSLGHPDDFKNAEFHRLLVNAVFWAMNKSLPDERLHERQGRVK